MIFSRKQKQVESRLSDYCDTVRNCLEEFSRAIKEHCQTPNWDAIKDHTASVHKAESLADDIRREIEVMMYSKALFPESRGDILGLLETMDRVPNQAESVVCMIYEQRVEIPDGFCTEVLALVDACSRCVESMLESVGKLFSDYTSAAVAVGKIDELESEADRLESILIQRAFCEEMQDVKKIVFRDFVKHIAQVSDRAEDVGDRIRVIVAKRGI